MHGKLDLANAKGLKKSEVRLLNRILQQRIPKDKILTLDLADSVAEISYSTGYPVSVVVNRRGQIVNVTVGDPKQVNVPELKGVRVGPGRLCGHRIIHTHITPQKSERKSKNGTEAGNEATRSFSKDCLICLAKNRLDLLAQIDVDPDGTFSRSHGEQAKMADMVHIAHLLPGRDSDGQLWKIL
ncbi:MAG: hypothetical protein K2Z81_08380, partial [Cyanobacteria bacterium]|nr:hypothetical protein [Cyanobacteriota bacterium]